MKTKILSLFVALFATTTLWAYDFKYGDLYYSITGDKKEVAVTSNYGDYYELISVSIPSFVVNDGITYSVTSIGSSAFYGCTSLTSITIPNSVTNIESSAFYGCTGLVSITIPNSVTSIGAYAFEGCTGLTSVTTGNGVTSIGFKAFYGCTCLTSISIGNSVTSIEGSSFGLTDLTSVVVASGNITYDSRDKCNAIIETATNTLVLGCKTTSIPNSVTSIGDCAFMDCTGLVSITIPNSITSIGEYAFENCTALTSITIPNSVMNIGRETFLGCTSLTSIFIPNSVTSIGEYAFCDCTGLTSITIPNSVMSIGYAAFAECTGLTSITIPNSVTSIGSGAFQKCKGLTSVIIGNNNELKIESYAFVECENLTSVTCYADVPPIIEFSYEYWDDEGNILDTPIRVGAFDVDKLSQMRLYVPAKAISQYKEAEEWKGFGQILPIGATTVDTGDEQPTVKPSFAEVTITWKIIPNAETYTIAITRGTETVCTLVFNADGQLTNIAFAAPSRYGTPRHAPAAVMTEQGYQFTVTGLESGTQYDYTLSVKDGNGKDLQNYAGTFRTQGAGEGTAIDNPTADGAATQPKVIRDGQMLIQRDGKTYTVTGMEVK